MKRFCTLAVSLLAAGLIATSCASEPAKPAAPAEPPDTRAQDEAAIRSASKDWAAAAAAKDADKFVSFYAQDAVVMLAGQPDFKGKTAIQDAIGGMMKDPAFNLSWQTDSVEVARSGDLAYELTPYSITVTDPKTKKPSTEKGVGITVWKKENGAWKVRVDAPISDPAAPATPAK
jgi:uncharacterized protein (TIGR02246 family)